MKIGYSYRINRLKNNHTEGGRKVRKQESAASASRVSITMTAQNDDRSSDYFQDDSRQAQEKISGHAVATVAVEFPLPVDVIRHQYDNKSQTRFRSLPRGYKY
jgi:hypothetical protein